MMAGLEALVTVPLSTCTRTLPATDACAAMPPVTIPETTWAVAVPFSVNTLMANCGVNGPLAPLKSNAM